MLVYVVRSSSSPANKTKKANKTKTGVALAGLNLPGGPAYTEFTEELFHTEQFQVDFKQTNLKHIFCPLEICQFHDNPLDRFGDRLGELNIIVKISDAAERFAWNRFSKL